jgi:mannose-6-phosphate isomerase-like protein (cupin superfamily)
MATKALIKTHGLPFFLLLIFPASAFAAESERANSEIAAPPVEHASFHQLVFANEDFAVLNNRYPPGGDSGFHAHYRDIFYVVIEAVPSSAQSPGGPLKTLPAAPAGSAGYGPIGAEPRVHRVVNSDEGPSQFIVVEIRRESPAGDEAGSREGASQYVRIEDNPRMRAWRLTLAPGEAAPAITQVGDGVRIVVRGGLLTTSAPGAPDQTWALKAGEFAVQGKGTTRALRNSGTETIELIELELK